MKWKTVVYKVAATFFRHDIASSEETNPKWCGWLFGGLKVFTILVVLSVIGGVWIIGVKKRQNVIYTGLSGTTTSVRGVAVGNLTTARREIVYDAQDILMPVEEEGAFFVTTNPITTNAQQRGECTEYSTLDDVTCADDTDCTRGHVYVGGHGVSTGECNKTAGACIVQAWCPLEDESLLNSTDNVLHGISDFTALIKNYVHFPEFNITLSNAKRTEEKRYLDKCVFDPVTNHLCPVFKLGYMIHEALKKKGSQSQKESYERIASKGGVISVKISWNCDFNLVPIDCLPTYDFNQLEAGERNTIFPGFQIRNTHLYQDSSGIETRRLVTAIGIRFITAVDAKATAADALTGFLAFGSALAYSSPFIAAISFVGDFFDKKEAKCEEPEEVEMLSVTGDEVENCSLPSNMTS